MEKSEYKVMYEIENTYWWYRGLHELVLGAIEKYCGTGKDIAVLDAGCGTGRMLELLYEYPNCEGFDNSPDAFDFCRRRGLTNVRVEDLNTWEAPGEKYDCIVSLDVLYHTAVVDDLAVIKKFQQALKPGGILVMNLPASAFLKRRHDRAIWTKRRYEVKKLRNDLTKTGLVVELITYRLFFPSLLLMAEKIKELIFMPKKIESDLKKLPPFLNTFFLFINRCDNKRILDCKKSIFGSSVFVICLNNEY